MRANRCWREAWPSILAIGCAAVLACAPAAAGGAQDELQVSARVPQVVRVRAMSTLPPLEVGAAATRQGYFDPPLPLKLEIVTNSASSTAGQQVQVRVPSDAVRFVTLRAASDSVGEQPSWVAATPGHGMRRVEVQLWLRIYLSDEAGPGTYQWPLEISMVPL